MKKEKDIYLVYDTSMFHYAPPGHWPPLKKNKKTCVWQKSKGMHVFGLLGAVNAVDVNLFNTSCGTAFSRDCEYYTYCPKCGKKIEYSEE